MSNFFSILIPSIKRFFQLFFPKAKQLILSDVLALAMKIVTELNQSDLSNEEKRKEAFLRIKSAFKDDVRGVKDSLINLAIEMAVQTWK